MHLSTMGKLGQVLLIIFSSPFVTYLLGGVEGVTFTLKNNCPYTIWPATLSGAGSPVLSSTGFELATGSAFSMDVPTPWSGRFWARSFCLYDSTGSFRCATGDCASGQISCKGAGGNSPATLAEFTLAGDQGKDFYDVSLVDGFNLPVSVVPHGAGCRTTSCAADVNAGCPAVLAVITKSPNTNTDPRTTNPSTVGCNSACVALKEPQYCCTGAYGTPQTCKPTIYSNYFKSKCPQAYSYAYDDPTSTFTCPTGGNYLITFCP